MLSMYTGVPSVIELTCDVGTVPKKSSMTSANIESLKSLDKHNNILKICYIKHCHNRVN